MIAVFVTSLLQYICPPSKPHGRLGQVQNARMTAVKTILVPLVVLLAGCTGVPASTAANMTRPSPCAAGEASMECQVERYNNVNAD